MDAVYELALFQNSGVYGLGTPTPTARLQTRDKDPPTRSQTPPKTDILELGTEDRRTQAEFEAPHTLSIRPKPPNPKSQTAPETPQSKSESPAKAWRNPPACSIRGGWHAWSSGGRLVALGRLGIDLTGILRAEDLSFKVKDRGLHIQVHALFGVCLR